MNNGTQPPVQHQPPNGGDGVAPIISSPLWADQSSFDHDTEQIVGVTHLWTAPTIAQVIAGRGESAPLPVHLRQRDDLLIESGGIWLEPGRPQVWVAGSDLTFPDTAEARRLAAALVEACDRLDRLNGHRA